jgi:hypothetical protein
MSNNLLIGAISSNYTPTDIRTWVVSSKNTNSHRVLLLYNSLNDELIQYLRSHDVDVVIPEFDFWGNEKLTFNTNTGVCNLDVSYDLIHNIRFLHIWSYLQNHSYDKVLITDVKDVCFNKDPFEQISDTHITATSEEIFYSNENWNKEHLHYNIGIIGLAKLLDKQVYNVGVFGGPCELINELCADIYLSAVGRKKVADQTAFNYLIQTKYKNQTKFLGLQDNFAVHLQVVVNGLVNFDLTNLNRYSIIHQYDRVPSLKYSIEAKYNA